MFEEDTAFLEESPEIALKSEIVDFQIDNAYGGFKETVGTSNPKLKNFQRKTIYCDDSSTKVNEVSTSIIYSEDYQLLPKKFFKLNEIYPPLVCKKWLEKIRGTSSKKFILENNTDYSSEDESTPLLKLKYKLKNFKEKHKIESLNVTLSSFKNLDNICINKCWKSRNDPGRQKTSKPIIKSKDTIVQRKRGRPKKLKKDFFLYSSQDNSLIKEGEISDSQNEDIWNSNSNSSQDVKIIKETEEEIEENNYDPINYYEHDYFKQSERNVRKTENENLNKGNRKKKTVIQNFKKFDSKISFPCKDCGKSFSAASTLKHHLRIHNGTLLKCPECQKGFTTNYLLKCHMRIHNGDLFMCLKCGKGFITAELLKVHSRGHSGDRPFSCDVCQKAFPSASNLSQHKQTHDTEKKFLCFQCGSAFSQKRCLDGHMRTHSEKNHICTVCGKLWARKSDLSEHMRVHTGVKPYSCDVCPQKFTQASSLKRHKIVHLNKKPIQCMTCNKFFKCEQYYKRHLKKHVTEDNFFFANEISKN